MTRNQNVICRAILEGMVQKGWSALGVRADGSYYPCYTTDIPAGAVDSYSRLTEGGYDDALAAVCAYETAAGRCPEHPSFGDLHLREITAEIMGGRTPVTIAPRHDPEADVPDGHIRLHGDWWALSQQSGDKSYSGRYLTIYPPGSLLPGSIERPKAPIHSFGDWVQTCYAPFGGECRHLLITFDAELRLRIFEAPKLDGVA